MVVSNNERSNGHSTKLKGKQCETEKKKEIMCNKV